MMTSKPIRTLAGATLMVLAVQALPATAQTGPVINAPFDGGMGQAPADVVPRDVVEEYVGAFNARDVDLMEALMHPGIQVMEVSAAGTEMTSEGYWAIVSHWLEHITDPETPVLELSDWSQLDDYVTAVETSRWTDQDGAARSQRRLTIYQVTDLGAIRRIWYYPVVAKQ